MDPIDDLMFRVRHPLRWSLRHPVRALVEMPERACATINGIVWVGAGVGCVGFWAAVAWLLL